MSNSINGSKEVFLDIYFVPSQESPFKCKVCNKQWYQAASLKAHVLAEGHWTKGSFNYKCDFCNERFMTEAHQKVHMMVHRITDEKRKKCQTCGEKFSSYNKLKKHISKKHGSRSDKCWMCGEVTNDMKTHMLSHVMKKKK